MPPKLNVKGVKAPEVNGNSAPSTPVEANAPEGNRRTVRAQLVSVVSQSGKNPKGKAKNSNVNVFCKGSDKKSCGKPVQDDELGGIECEICLCWFHPECQGMCKETYEIVQKNETFWLCENCRELIPEFRAYARGRAESAVEGASFNKMEKKLDDMNKAFQENIKEVKDGLAKVETVRKTYTDAIGSQEPRNEHRVDTPNNLQECLESFQQENKEQAKRKCNLAIVNMPESIAEETDHRVKEDTDFITDAIKQELKIHVQIEKSETSW